MIIFYFSQVLRCSRSPAARINNSGNVAAFIPMLFQVTNRASTDVSHLLWAGKTSGMSLEKATFRVSKGCAERTVSSGKRQRRADSCHVIEFRSDRGFLQLSHADTQVPIYFSSEWFNFLNMSGKSCNWRQNNIYLLKWLRVQQRHKLKDSRKVLESPDRSQPARTQNVLPHFMSFSLTPQPGRSFIFHSRVALELSRVGRV